MFTSRFPAPQTVRRRSSSFPLPIDRSSREFLLTLSFCQLLLGTVVTLLWLWFATRALHVVSEDITTICGLVVSSKRSMLLARICVNVFFSSQIHLNGWLNFLTWLCVRSRSVEILREEGRCNTHSLTVLLVRMML